MLDALDEDASMSRDLPAQAEIVIIGGGVIGASVAWHLARLGRRDVVLLERGRLGCGTTWHSAGNIIRMSADPMMVGLYSYGAALLAELHARRDIGWRRCGRMMMARTPERMAEFERVARTLQDAGVEVEAVAAERVGAALPMMRVDDLLGALWSPGDGRVNPTDLLDAYVREATAGGLRLIEGVNVEGARIADGRVSGVDTDHGAIRCETLVNCAGLWARDLGARDGVALPLYPVEHFYMLTEPLAGVYPEMPTFRDPDGLIYGREETGGLLMGCFDRNAIPVRPSELPAPFEFALLPENWDQFEPYMRECLHRAPGLAETGVRMLLNGPESFTPDSEPILDQAPDIGGYFVLAGLSSAGVARSAGLGRALARWIVDGDPGLDARRFSLRRFPPEANREEALRDAVRHAPSGFFDRER